MVNVSLGPNVFLGIMIGFGIAIFYFLRDAQPELSRDEDIFFATVTLIYCCILIVHGWRLDPILLFSQFLIILIVLVVGWENIRLRYVVKDLSELTDEEED